MKTIDTLIPDIEALFDGHDCSDEKLDIFMDTLKAQIKRTFAGYKEQRGGTLRMSNIGKPCHRALWYDVRGFEAEPLSPSAKMKFLYGHIIEALIIYLAKEAGHEVQDEQMRVQLDGINGSIDCIIDGVLVDVKSASSYSYKKFKDGTLADNDPFGYLAQLSGYRAAVGAERAGFLAIDKTLGHMCLYEPESLPEPLSIIQATRASVNSEVAPERLSGASVPEGKGGNEKLSMTCSYCSYKQGCWKDANEGQGLRCFLYSTGPVWLTKVEKVPNVLEVKVGQENPAVQ